jgi:mono/diheme cytochrome c family protein
MAEVQLLGLFRDVAATAEALAQLRPLGVPDDHITVMSGIPLKPEMLGRHPPRTLLSRITLTGTLLGLMGAALLTFGMFLAYRLNQGGQGLTPIPPTLIVFFEVSMLGTMGLTFLGLFLVNDFPVLKPTAYDPRITEGAIGLAVDLEEALLERAEGLLTAAGAFDCRRLPASPKRDTRRLLFITAAGALALGGAAVLGLWAYDVIKLPTPTQMSEQPSLDYDQGPRLAAPVSAVPVQGPELIAGQPATEPLPATTASLQRGQVLFGLHCALCHGATGVGNGKVGIFFTPTKPADLTGAAVQRLSADQLFVILTQGAGVMPPLAENLSVGERWDVINFVRTLKK